MTTYLSHDGVVVQLHPGVVQQDGDGPPVRQAGDDLNGPEAVLANSVHVDVATGEEEVGEVGVADVVQRSVVLGVLGTNNT